MMYELATRIGVMGYSFRECLGVKFFEKFLFRNENWGEIGAKSDFQRGGSLMGEA